MIILINFLLLLTSFVNSGSIYQFHKMKHDDGRAIYMYGTRHTLEYGETVGNAILEELEEDHAVIDEVFVEMSPNDAIKMSNQIIEDNKDHPHARILRLYWDYYNNDVIGKEIMFDTKVSGMVSKQSDQKVNITSLDDNTFRMGNSMKKSIQAGLKFAEKHANLSDDELLKAWLASKSRAWDKENSDYSKRERGSQATKLRYLDEKTQNRGDEGGILMSFAKWYLSAEARNRLWAEKLAQTVQKGKPVFLAIGAAHLYGNQGMIQLLKNQGYKHTETYLNLKYKDEEKKEIVDIRENLPKMNDALYVVRNCFLGLVCIVNVPVGISSLSANIVYQKYKNRCKI